MSSAVFRRDRATWQAYISIGYFSYLLNVLGPLTPFLRDELRLSYTVASLHFSAYSLGTLVTGLVASHAIRRFGAYRAMWLGAFGTSIGALLIMVGRHPAVTITGGFLMGLMGIIIVSIFQGALAERHGEQRAIALTESTTFSSVMAALSPVAVGFFSRTGLTWRAALASGMLLLVGIWVAFSRDPVEAGESGEVAQPEAGAPRKRLPALFWIFWTSALLAVSIEFCMITWGADYLGKVVGLSRSNAALGMSVFMGAMLLGRLVNSRLVFRLPASQLTGPLLGLASAGFLLFWLAPGAWATAGLGLTGLGVSGLYPLFASQALGACPGQMVEGSARFLLASGLAIFALPLLLGRLADWMGIHAAYGLVAVLLVLSVVVLAVSSRVAWRLQVRQAAA